jgi:hypothetical protein
MKVPLHHQMLVGVHIVVLLFGVTTLLCHSAFGQTQTQRYWLAGRYDPNRIIVYFDAVKFNGTLPTDAKKIPCPVAVGFFCPVQVPASYVAKFQKAPNAEHFAIGDKYDLIVGGNSTVTVTLTTLVGFESDEAVGNDSLVGALATLENDKQDWLYYDKSYLAVRRHRAHAPGGGQGRPSMRTVYAHLLDEPVQFDVQSEIVALLKAHMNAAVSESRRREAESVSPYFAVQQFKLADGSLRYYARAGWKSGKGRKSKLIYGLGAWIAPLPSLHIQAVESAAGFEYLPKLLNVIDLGNGRTAIVISEHGDDSQSLSLVEYRDGADISHMRTLQSIGAENEPQLACVLRRESSDTGRLRHLQRPTGLWRTVELHSTRRLGGRPSPRQHC